jgi:hypothetical protein
MRHRDVFDFGADERTFRVQKWFHGHSTHKTAGLPALPANHIITLPTWMGKIIDENTAFHDIRI